ncbi:non-ribosomal peptide synthetase [Streptomyces cinereoruber]|uniref:Amino acid adenylation domain-containing protein n=7 Tax=Streptomyces cinereoruber TaxID=67260 RepID=A0ABX6BPU8_9ACTN|nr:non-ribosomal peptide synthetase [Streptomyces cinereoruber]MBB4158107.1 amino acid adenylation domain-containing protein [Streptomyces cinereoruber]NIH61740.1 amino acid adenylation domain-containing protein [Streptomyces cinereoruber]QEV35917.1 amino acid adenylation domain-containing protein [Streptomyces cinereoruber]
MPFDTPVAPAPAAVRLPLSVAQRDIWTAHLLDPTGVKYNVGECREINGPVDPELMAAAWRRLVDEADFLRIRGFEEDGEEVRQLLDPDAGDRTLPFHDVSAADDPEAAAWRLIDGLIGAPFDLTGEAPVRCVLVKLAEDRFFYFYGFHHLVVDGVGVAMALARLVELYERAVAGEPWGDSPFGSLAELLAEDAAYRSSADAAADLAAWRDHLAGAPDAPTGLVRGRDRAPAAHGALPFSRRSVRVSAADAERLRTAARAERVNWSVVLIALFGVYLHRVTARDELVLALPVTGRTTRAARSTPGMASNIVPLRLRIRPDDTFGELLRATAAAVKHGLRHQRTRYEDLRRDAGADRRLASPVLNIMGFHADLTVGGHPTVNHNVSNGPVDDLNVAVLDLGAAHGLRIDFDTPVEGVDPVLTATHQDRFAAFVTAVLAAEEAPGVRRVADLDVLRPEERTLLTRDWAGPVAVPTETTLVARFEERVRLHPDRTALVDADGTVTYAALDAAANRLARRLADRGLGRGQLAGVLLERGVPFSVALIAVLKTGAAHVLLDPDFPDERLRSAAADAGITHLVTRPGLADRLTGTWTTHTDPAADAAAAPDARPGPDTEPGPGVRISPDDPACLMFTSGSTGRPKAILSSHRNLVATLLGQPCLPTGTDQVWLQSSPVSWDAFSLEFWGALLHGGTAVLQPGQKPEPALVAELARRHGVTTLLLSATLFNYLTDEHPEAFETVTTAFTVGEAASPAHVHKLQRLKPGITVLNGYGPAEVMIFATTHAVEPAGAPHEVVPVGAPLVNKPAYVLDPYLNLCPPGVTGELYVGGEGLAHGYLGRPDLTAARFVPDPFGPAGARLYRTGDLVHFDAGGRLVYEGRADDQIKIRGFRVEPGETQAALLAHPDVTQAVVTVHQQRLAAYLVLDSGPTAPDTDGGARPDAAPGTAAHADAHPDPEAFRRHVADRLPEHLVPTYVTVLDRLPVTPNGKIDKRALPAPDTTSSAARRAPRDRTEATLAALFSLTLDTAEVGIDDSFFALGGHSLLAARLTNRIAEALDVRLTLRDVFERPTVAGLAALIAERGGTPVTELPPLVAGEAEVESGLPPASFAQRRLWLLSQLDGGSAAYNVPMVVRLEHGIDADALESALGAVIGRHAPLRTVFEAVDGEPYQRVLPVERARLTLERVPVASDAELDAALDEAAGRVFDLAADLPIRAQLLERPDGSGVLSLVLHHVATDGLSQDAFFADLERAYAGEVLEPPAVGYADYAVWQRRVLGAADDPGSLLGRELAYWREALTGLPEEHGLTLDRPRPARASHRGGGIEVDFGPDVFERVVVLAREEGCTPFMVVHAALVAALSRLGAGSDLAIGSPVAGRSDEALAGLVGFFVNTLVLRTDSAGDPTFRDLLGRVRAADLDAFAHQEAPFDLVLEAVNPARSLARHPLFQICLTLEATPDAPAAATPVFGPVEKRGNGSAKFDLEFFLRSEDGAELSATVLFAADVFDAETVRRMTSLLGRVCHQVLDDPGVRLSALDVLTPEERALLTGSWAGSAAETGDASLVVRFEEAAARFAERTALVDGGRRVSYAELNASANRLAHLLRAHGLGRGDLAGVLLDRGADFAVAVLAVVKAGAAYTLLDPDFPDERLRSAAADAGISLLLTAPAHAARVEGAWPTVLFPAHEDLAAFPADALETGPTGDDAACLMFTSGSTGRPKGILSSHRNLVSTVSGQSYGRFGPDEVFLQCSPVSWDAFSLEFWGALLHGGSTVLQPGQRPEPALISELSRCHGVTMLQLSASLFNFLVDEHPDAFTTVTVAYTGGEAASPAHVDKLRRERPGVTVVNGYGPAESMGFTTTHLIDDAAGSQAAVPIGTPLMNKGAYVLDGRLDLCPPGVTGELYLAGEGLAHGYLRRPDLTASRFVPDPFGPAGGRLYRTGDLARFDAGGRLVYEGRADDQIKIRGFRVEPGETETALLTHPDVTQAVVTVQDERLAAYLVTGGTASPDEIRRHVAERLPDHLVPTHVTVLDRLPLTPNGKIDKRALPAPTAPTTDGRAPRTPLEETLVALFSLTLDTAEVGIDDSFFALGGHSLLAARLTNRIAGALDVRLTLRDVFERPTVAGLAALIAEQGGTGAVLPPLVAGEAEVESGLPPASFAQRRLWLLSQLDGGSAAYNVPMVVRLEHGIDADALESALGAVVGRHAPLRTLLEAVDGEPRQRVLPPEHARLTVERVPVASDAALDEALARSAGHVFDLAADLPIRAQLLERPDGSAVLSLVLHHVATDGLSNGVFFGDLERAYAGEVLEPPAVGYADYAVWQRRVLGAADDPGSLLGRELAYWREALAGLPEEHGLTLDRPRPARASHRGGGIEVDFGPDVFERVVVLAREEGCTPFMVVHAALVAALSRLGAGSDLAIGSPVAGRSDEALAGLVGFFVNTLVLRTDSAGDPTFRDLLGRVRAADLDAFAHQEAPFDLVLEAVNPARSLARHPLFQICLGLETGGVPRLALPELPVATVAGTGNGAAKFDLEFLLRSDDGRRLHGSLLYAAELFDPETVRRTAALLGRVLDQVLTDPGLRLSDLEVLTVEQRALLTGSWAGSAAETGDASLVVRFEEAAARFAERTALVDGGRRVSYAELNASANRLAHLLRAHGLGRGDLAGVLLDRGADFAVAVLAVVKAGAAYTLLDPDFPDERLRSAAADAGISLLLTAPAHAARIEGPWRTVGLPSRGELAVFPAVNPSVDVNGDDAACVMFTSGSTGRPKGILSSHRNLVSTVSGQSYGRFGPDEVFLQCSPVSWDAFSLEFWGALLHGGSTVLQPGQRPEPALISELSRCHGVTMLQLSASLFNFLVDEHPDAFTTVTVAYTGGEAASPAHVDKLRRERPGVTVVNGYGPAESMGFTTTHLIAPGTVPGLPLPIGVPLVNKGAYVLDGRLDLCPPGVTGELYLAGEGLAHGYLGRPDLTASRFVPDPFGPAGGRLYRTGDLARFDAGGRLVYEGRADDQIKIRGFRVEPGETETALLTHPDVTQAVVTVHEERLAAYLVTNTDSSPDEIRRHVAERLPDHLVPTHVTVLDRLPLTPNGKIDKRALPAPTAPTTDGRAPRTPLEETLVALFAHTLDTTTPLTIDDDFFHLGGHSLLAARLTNRIAGALDVRLTVRDVFQHPTPARLAAHLDSLKTAPAARKARPALRRRTETDRISS